MDAYSDSSKILFYNLKGISYANSFQAMLNYELIEDLGIRLAYKFDDVKSTYNGKLEQNHWLSRKSITEYFFLLQIMNIGSLITPLYGTDRKTGNYIHRS